MERRPVIELFGLAYSDYSFDFAENPPVSLDTEGPRLSKLQFFDHPNTRFVDFWCELNGVPWPHHWKMCCLNFLTCPKGWDNRGSTVDATLMTCAFLFHNAARLWSPYAKHATTRGGEGGRGGCVP